MRGSSKLKLWLAAAVSILLISVSLVFAPAWGEGGGGGGLVAPATTATAIADEQFVKPGDSFTVTFSLTNVTNMYNYQIDLPLGSLKAIAVKDGRTSDVATFAHTIDPAGIEDDSLNQLAQELVKLYNNMDDNDKDALENARERINAAPERDWSQLLAPVLNNLTDQAKNALGSNPCAQLRCFILDGLNIYYTPNTNADQVAQQLKIFRSTYKPMITRVFGDGVAVVDIWRFILAVQDALPNQFTLEDLELLRNKGFAIIEARLQEWLNGAIDETMNKPEYQVFKNKLAEVGLTRDILIRTKDNLFNAAEQNLSAEQAVVKAYVRSRVELAGETTLLAGNTETYQLKALGVALASLLKWHSSDPTVADFTDNTKPGKLSAIKEGTTTVTAYWDTQDGLTRAWLKRFDVTVTVEPGEVVAVVTGKVIKQDGTSFEGVSVQLWQDGRLKLETKTDPQGAFSFSEVAPGVYELVAFAPGYLKTKINIELSPGGELYEEIQLAPANPSDLDGSGVVDDTDLELFMIYYWQAREEGLYDPVFDLFQDEKIDIRDLVMAGKKFGYGAQ